MTREDIEVAFKTGKEMNSVMIATYIKTRETTKIFEHFAKNHFFATTIFITLIAIEVLMILISYVVEMLKFEELEFFENELTISFCCLVIEVLIIIQIPESLRGSLLIVILCSKVLFFLTFRD